MEILNSRQGCTIGKLTEVVSPLCFSFVAEQIFPVSRKATNNVDGPCPRTIKIILKGEGQHVVFIECPPKEYNNNLCWTVKGHFLFSDR
jgi:hypothetical protein